MIPGSNAALLRDLDLRAQFALRTVLRRLRRQADATLGLLWIADVFSPEVVEWDGERAVMPVTFPFLESTMPSPITVRGRLGGEHLMLVTPVRVGRGMPVLAAAAIDAGIQLPAGFELLEEIGAELEETLVVALTRPGRRSRAEAEVAGRRAVGG